MKKLLLSLAALSTLTVTASELPELDSLINEPEFLEYKDSLKEEVVKTHENYQLYIEELQNKGEISPMAPAPKLTYLEIRGVRSAKYPQWDNISASSFSTNQDHGGEFYAVTLEYGYATPSSRRFQVNGLTLSLALSDPIKDAGNIVIGYVNYWHNTQTSFSSGTSTYKATSINFPYNTEDDRLYIR
ncbi:DUF4879 domain-containing protein [Pseudoalteromonas luteoviolacea]|uniref:Uncharacterized protein n=1 Tax=Pseudoalteromonas luteoviolacea S4054 TaxID=1129367 RepID=A0A0F6AAX2_9GAMM|nr:DUF4879 domain-containing protein [Pseudoalteromonas luteoviolacea]AOT08622.1 hypothetical protein S4054249_12495 [Pseudoalteromonas luteoviolacea]AOT13537.1 hypothetical protein S40542_12470 [Pseudoalteromonas luteoviolacea]AOT18450.1 hypothetical protein S4054_12470 [Pseudoalteromonas luteoviolacea]KKE82554.1 hypothetical protein N479_18270 [Pseudoalteromonas luteoviolacea S4054]KZN72091.1 hypothetical protein N481_16905 [Pseudoalteromonas luteoviolacea S4047-1]